MLVTASMVQEEPCGVRRGWLVSRVETDERILVELVVAEGIVGIFGNLKQLVTKDQTSSW